MIGVFDVLGKGSCPGTGGVLLMCKKTHFPKQKLLTVVERVVIVNPF